MADLEAAEQQALSLREYKSLRSLNILLEQPEEGEGESEGTECYTTSTGEQWCATAEAEGILIEGIILYALYILAAVIGYRFLNGLAKRFLKVDITEIFTDGYDLLKKVIPESFRELIARKCRELWNWCKSKFKKIEDTADDGFDDALDDMDELIDNTDFSTPAPKSPTSSIKYSYIEDIMDDDTIEFADEVTDIVENIKAFDGLNLYSNGLSAFKTRQGIEITGAGAEEVLEKSFVGFREINGRLYLRN
jgi:hypothetical protein